MGDNCFNYNTTLSMLEGDVRVSFAVTFQLSNTIIVAFTNIETSRLFF